MTHGAGPRPLKGRIACAKFCLSPNFDSTQYKGGSNLPLVSLKPDIRHKSPVPPLKLRPRSRTRRNGIPKRRLPTGMNDINTLFPGVANLRFGTPEAGTPVQLRSQPPYARGLTSLPDPGPCPIGVNAIRGRKTRRGYSLDIPLEADEELYGFGLQLHSFRQRERGKPGKKKTLRVNSDPVSDTGDSHAPVPFYVSTRGYGILIDTARYTTFYCGCAERPKPATVSGHGHASQPTTASSAEDLYATLGEGGVDATATFVNIDVPHAEGADIYLFWGTDLLAAVQRYNLFSGGGCLPPQWGLGVWYRAHAGADQDGVLATADLLRETAMPCDVLGLEPGWQSRSYPCTFEWSSKFPEPANLLAELRGKGYRVNLWTHVFVHPEAKIYPDLEPLSGDLTGFGGLVPDLSLPAARETLARQHEAEHVSIGVSGYKLDECDNSDYIPYSWSFPEITNFPSGLDGEQMHSLLGLLYQETIDGIFRRRNQRGYHAVRSSQALAAPYPFVLYSDLYDHRDFIRGVAVSGFSGLLWTPEVRHAVSPEDLIRRLQSVVCSPQALINCWYIMNPPWRQWEAESNNRGELAPNHEPVEAACRDIFNLRMRLVPYLYAAFHRYRESGIPPFRPLVMDYPEDLNLRAVDNAYMMGDRLLVVPLVAGETEREIYLPEGEWWDFFTGAKVAGGEKFPYAAELDRFPLFVKDGSVLPLAQPTLHTGDPAARDLTIRIYGDGRLPVTLIEDDGETYGYESDPVYALGISFDAKQGIIFERGQEGPRLYHVVEWSKVS